MRRPRSKRAYLGAVLLGSAALYPAGSARAQYQQYPVPLTITYDQALHIAHRLSFGGTSSQIASLTGPVSNALSYISAQLAPNLANDHPDIPVLLAQIGTPVAPLTNGANHSLHQSQRGAFVYAALSAHQLAARMAYFWLRHFSTESRQIEAYLAQYPGLPSPSDAATVTARLYWKEFEFFRQNGLGSFRQLAAHGFFSPTALIYLDTVASKCVLGVGKPNENESRETQELKTIGPRYLPTNTPNYGVAEIAEHARAMSGWSISGTGFAGSELQAIFLSADHCPTTGVALYGSPQIGTFAYPAGPGTNPALHVDLLLDHLVASEACKDFICRKLMTEFLGDGTDLVFPHLLSGMKQQWGTTGNIAGVLSALFTSGEFLGAHTRWERAQTPMEICVSHARIWDGSFTSGNPPAPDGSRVVYLRDMSRILGERLFEFPSPDGFPLGSLEQIGSGITIDTLRQFVASFYTSTAGPVFDYLTISGYQQDSTLLARALLSIAFGSPQSVSNPRGWTPTDEATVIDALEKNVNGVPTGLAGLTPAQYSRRVAIATVAIMSMSKGRLR
jgi:uncharacterized protein (DUF1800 family)